MNVSRQATAVLTRTAARWHNLHSRVSLEMNGVCMYLAVHGVINYEWLNGIGVRPDGFYTSRVGLLYWDDPSIRLYFGDSNNEPT